MKKHIKLLITITLISSLLVACGGNQAPKQTPAESEKRTITDMVGRTVEVPAKVEKIVPLGNTPRMITYLGLAKNAVGIASMPYENIGPVTAYAYANKELWANLPIVGTDAAGATDYYPEQIIQAGPDVIFCTYTSDVTDKIQAKTGIPTVAVSMGTLFAEDYKESLRTIADVCGVKERAEEVISFINDSLKDLENRTKDIPQEDKPSLLGAAATFKGPHGIEGIYSNYPVFMAIAANDLAQGVSDTVGGILVDKEQILGWNPQYLFLDSGGVGLVKQDYKENPDFYHQLQAVENDMMFQYPSSTSYFSNVEIPIVNSYYVGSTVYPEQFKDISFEDKANEIFKFFLGVDNYLDVLEEAGHGYTKVTLAEN